MFCEGGAAEEGEGAGRVTGGGPAGAAVEAHAFVGDDAEYATAAEGFGVGLAFDLEDVEGKEDDFADTDQTDVHVSAQSSIYCGSGKGAIPSSCGVHDSFARTFAERSVKLVAVVLCEVISCEWLTAIFVYSLEDLKSSTSCLVYMYFAIYLVSCSVTETREKRGKFREDWSLCLLLEDNGIEL